MEGRQPMTESDEEDGHSPPPASGWRPSRASFAASRKRAETSRGRSTDGNANHHRKVVRFFKMSIGEAKQP